MKSFLTYIFLFLIIFSTQASTYIIGSSTITLEDKFEVKALSKDSHAKLIPLSKHGEHDFFIDMEEEEEEDEEELIWFLPAQVSYHSSLILFQ